MINGKKVTAIILAAGKSTRYGMNRNKNFEIIQGKKVLEYSLDVFCENEAVDDIMIASRENEIPIIEEMIQTRKNLKTIRIVIGGESRQESVYHCITQTDADYVMIHDGARPYICQEDVQKCLSNMQEYKGVSIAVKAKDTVKITDDDGIVIQTTNRKNTWLSQTPQCFDRKILVELHEKYQEEDATDDCFLLEKAGYPVKLLEGDYRNIKITTYDDTTMMKSFLE